MNSTHRKSQMKEKTGIKTAFSLTRFMSLVFFYTSLYYTENKDFIKDFFSKCDQIRNFLRIWSHLLKKCLMENFIFCALFGWNGLNCVGKFSQISLLIISKLISFYFLWNLRFSDNSRGKRSKLIRLNSLNI